MFGDYGAGPNHTLPTGGTARCFSGLSVHTFLKKQTMLQLRPPGDGGGLAAMEDAEKMGLLEGLHGHARAARLRLEAAAAAAASSQPQRTPGGGSGGGEDRIKLALPKGRMQDNVLELMREAGLNVELKGRVLRPKIRSFPDWDIK